MERKEKYHGGLFCGGNWALFFFPSDMSQVSDDELAIIFSFSIVMNYVHFLHFFVCDFVINVRSLLQPTCFFVWFSFMGFSISSRFDFVNVCIYLFHPFIPYQMSVILSNRFLFHIYFIWLVRTRCKTVVVTGHSSESGIGCWFDFIVINFCFPSLPLLKFLLLHFLYCV